MAAPVTPSKTSTSGSSKQPTTIAGVRAVLYENLLRIDDDEAFQTYPAIGEAAMDILGGERGSDMQPESLEELHYVRRQFAPANEYTFLAELWGVLLHKHRHIAELDAQAKVQWIQRAWRKDHCRPNWSADFARNSIPPIRTTDAFQARLLDSLPRIKNPKPDLTYGLQREAFTEIERNINSVYVTSSMLSRDLFHSFFVVEVKCADGTIEDAENQCCRAGSAMVHARRKFDQAAYPPEAENSIGSLGSRSPMNATTATSAQQSHSTPPVTDDMRRDVPSSYTIIESPESSLAVDADQENFERHATSYADNKSIAFSMALVPSKAHIFVHWAEVRSDKIIYHMNLVNSYDFRARDGKGFAALRHDIDNILDWGTLKRKYEISDICKEIVRVSKLNDIGSHESSQNISSMPDTSNKKRKI